MALIVATGFVVDDAIVVLENIVRYVEQGMKPFDAAIRGANEIGFTVLGASTTGTSPLTARQLLLVNLLTDLAPSLALAVRAPQASDARSLLAEGPEASLGDALNREIALRAMATAGGATLAWAQAQATPYGSPARARTVALAALVSGFIGGIGFSAAVLLKLGRPRAVVALLGAALLAGCGAGVAVGLGAGVGPCVGAPSPPPGSAEGVATTSEGIAAHPAARPPGRRASSARARLRVHWLPPRVRAFIGGNYSGARRRHAAVSA